MSGRDPWSMRDASISRVPSSYVSGRRLGGGTGSMALGNWDAGEGNYVTQRWVRARLLLHVPPRDQAATLVTIAARADIDPRACRDHFRCMPEVGALERANRKTRYYRRTEDDMMPNKHDPRPLPERIAELLGDDGAVPMTVLQIAGELRVRVATVTKSLIAMVASGLLIRAGVGKRGDPYSYNLAADDENVITLPVAEAAPFGVPTMAAPDSVPAAYRVVIADVQTRAREADHDRRMLDQVATLLGRILEGEAD